MNFVDTIKKIDCTGCNACFNVCPVSAIDMLSDEEGFWYPKINYDKCIRCGLCIKQCPTLCLLSKNKVLSSYAVINKNEQTRLKSSSGGVFSVIAKNIIAVDGIVFGAKFDKNFDVIHSFCNDNAGLSDFYSSKYVQSKIGDTYKYAEKNLKAGRMVLFSGTPCQIAGLKAYLNNEYSNLICVDLICHGVPSPKVWRKYISFNEICADSPMSKIFFRHKKLGWKLFSLLLLFENGKKIEKNLNEDYFMQAFLKNICLRPSCHNCHFKGLNRYSDLTLGDFWGIDKLMPEMFDDKGTSLVIVNTEKGKVLFDKIKDELMWKNANLTTALEYNSAALKSVPAGENRAAFFADLDSLPFDKLIKKYVKRQGNFKDIICKILNSMGLLGTAQKIKKYVKNKNG